MDGAVHRKQREIGDYIEAVKAEIAGLHFNELKHRRIPAASQELDAIVKATEAASHTIMECAEVVLAADARDPAFEVMVDEKMLVVFEAWDITGQRVAKVTETLKHIEVRVARFNDALRVRNAGGFVSEAERASAERKARLLLNGPRLDGDGHQSEVDRLLAKL